MATDQRSMQKENLQPTVLSPIRSNEVAPPLPSPVVLQQCNELLALQESLILSGIERRREQAQSHETSRAECEDVYSMLEVSCSSTTPPLRL